MMKHFHESEEMNALREQTEALEDINASFISALEIAAKNMQETLSDKTKNTATKSDVRSTGIRFSKKIEDYPYNMKTVIKEYLKSVDENLLSLVNKMINNPHSRFERYNISDVSERLSKDVSELLDIDISGYKNAMNTNCILHIQKEHGVNGKSDSSMSEPNDIARIGYVIKNYDNIEVVTYASGDVDYSAEFRNRDNIPVPMIKISKKINGTYYVVEALPESKYKKIWVVSAYIENGGAVTQAPNKSGSFLASPTSATSNISQISEKSSGTDSKNRKSYKITDTQQTSSENDKKYLDAVNRGDTKTAQQLVDEAAKKNGYTIKAYHGTPDARNIDRYGYKQAGTEFTIFDFKMSDSERIDGSGYYFTTNKKLAEFYAPVGKPHKKVYETFLKMEKPYIVNANGAEWYQIKDDEIKSSKMFGYESFDTVTHSWKYKYKDYFSTKQISKYAKTKGCDGVIFKNVLDGNPDDTSIGVSDVYVIFDNNKTKSADLVTYDDNGNIIPLSERFNEENKDIRYSIKLTQKSQRILDENPEIKNVLQDLQNELSLAKGFVPEGKVIHKYASQLKKDNPCNVSVAEIESDLREIYTVLSSMSGSEGYEYAADLTLNLAKKMLDNFFGR